MAGLRLLDRAATAGIDFGPSAAHGHHIPQTLYLKPSPGCTGKNFGTNLSTLDESVFLERHGTQEDLTVKGPNRLIDTWDSPRCPGPFWSVPSGTATAAMLWAALLSKMPFSKWMAWANPSTVERERCQVAWPHFSRPLLP